ncbi:MAG: hypothetical protein EXR93_04480 [Gemmatimonadetes bacterium]|nr:hypothetical protein [Gemmatimonadota bacterium]
MKFLCIECDEQMGFEERQQPGDGTFTASFKCPKCNRSVALLANPMETQLVGSLGVKIGGRTLDEQPMELIRSNVVGKDDAFAEEGQMRQPVSAAAAASSAPRWTPDANARLSKVPNFVRGMVKKIYAEYAAERSITEITPEVMDRARTELGLEGM